jgi:hypothetical protein
MTRLIAFDTERGIVWVNPLFIATIKPAFCRDDLECRVTRITMAGGMIVLVPLPVTDVVDKIHLKTGAL